MYTFTGGPVDGKSLADGVYQLKIDSAALTDDVGRNLDGNGDGVGGDDYLSPLTFGDPNRIHRLFGDYDGDADLRDFVQLKNAYGSTGSMPPYNAAFDSDGDGDVDFADLVQFKLRMGILM